MSPNRVHHGERHSPSGVGIGNFSFSGVLEEFLAKAFKDVRAASAWAIHITRWLPNNFARDAGHGVDTEYRQDREVNFNSAQTKGIVKTSWIYKWYSVFEQCHVALLSLFMIWGFGAQDSKPPYRALSAAQTLPYA